VGTKEKEAELVEILRSWQQIESTSLGQTSRIIEQTPNPVLRMVMEIIRHDSGMHHRVQQFIIDTFESRAVELSVEDLERVWGAIEAHIEAERRTGELVAAAQKALAGTKNVVQQYLLSYLAHDEKKHDDLLEDLQQIKRGMYRSA
jgi:hypothetical protein